MPEADALGSMLDEWEATTPGGTDSRSVRLPGRPASVAGADSVRYETAFADPRDRGDDVAVLELRGLYAHSEVQVGGDRVGGSGPVEHGCYFRPLRIPFRPEPETELAVTCHAPRDRFGGLHDTDLVPDSAAVPGIWWDVSLESKSLPYIESIDAEPEVTADGAKLHLRTTVVTGAAVDERITYSLRPADEHQTRGTMERASADTDGPGKTVFQHTVDVGDASLWWPRELGEQHLYELRAKLAQSVHRIRTGICNTTVRDGRLLVNGEPVPIRGVNLLTDDEMDVDRALELNANLVRAHAHVLPEELYTRCNEKGLLVWQDLPLTGPGGFDTDRGKEVARTLARQYGRNPSLAVYGVHDNPVDAFADGLGSGFLDRLRLRWRAWRSSYDDGPANAIAGELPGTRAVFPVVAGPGVGADAGAYYPGWEYGDPDDIDSLLDRYPADIVAEFGAGALAADAGNARSAVAGFDWGKHDRHVSGGVAASQAYQATVFRTVIEQLRRSQTGSIAFALRDTDTAGMGVFSRNGSRKAAADVIEEAYRPLQAFLVTPGRTESDVIVVNDTPRGRSVTLKWEAGGNGGSFTLTIDAGGRSTAGPIEIPGAADSVQLTVSVPEQTVEVEYDR